MTECVVALAVLSACATAIVAAGSSHLAHFARSHEETLACRAAASQLETVAVSREPLAAGTTSFRTSQRFGAAEWGEGSQTVTEVEPGLHRVEVVVTWKSAGGGDGSVRLATLVAR
jgi:hypothetical protein